MSWFSFFRKNKQESAAGDSDFYSQAEDASISSRARPKKKEEPVDPVLPEKKRARRRLVGAVALTLGLVIVLPMVLDSEPKLAADDVVIQIPSRVKTTKVGDSQTSSAVASASQKTIEATQPAVAAASVSATLPAAIVAAAPKNDKPVIADKPATKAAEPAKTNKPDAKENKIKAAADAAQGKFEIQVAALATQDKVKELQDKLGKAGIKSHTQKVATKDGERIRVRVGPFASKDEAEKTCPKLSKMNLMCTALPI